MEGTYVSFKDRGGWRYGEVLDYAFSPRQDEWLFFLALHSEKGTYLEVVSQPRIRLKDMRGYAYATFQE